MLILFRNDCSIDRNDVETKPATDVWFSMVQSLSNLIIYQLKFLC